MIELEERLDRAAGTPSPIDVDAIRARAHRRSTRRRAAWVGASLAVVALLVGGAVFAQTDPEATEIRTAEGPVPSTIAPPTTVPDGSLTITFDVLHAKEMLPPRVTIFAWLVFDAADVEADPTLADRYPLLARWEALYQNVELTPTGPAAVVGEMDDGTALFRSEVTAIVPDSAAQLIASFASEGWLAASPQRPGPPVACDDVERPCPHLPGFVPPDADASASPDPDDLSPYPSDS